MRLLEWFRVGVGIKRWIALCLIGVAACASGLVYFLTAMWWNTIIAFMSAFMIVSGVIIAALAIRSIVSRILQIASLNKSKLDLNSDQLSKLLYERRILINGPKIVAIGGGTGLSTLLRGLKKFSSNITAIVAVTDDGGGSGVLREELGILPPGDIRNCIMALANTEPIMQELLQYRFKEGRLRGQSFGNLFLAAMDDISENFESAVEKMSKVLAITGKVLPITNQKVELEAKMDNGKVIKGESKIAKYIEDNDVKIENISLVPDNVIPLDTAIAAILDADVVIVGPGSLYTSLLPSLLVNGVCDAIKKTRALKMYVCNLMTQSSETRHFNANEHVEEIEKFTYKGIFDYCFVNNNPIPESILEKYRLENSDIVYYSKKKLESQGMKVIEGNYLLFENEKVRHNAEAVAEKIISIVAEKVFKKDKKRELEYYLAKEKTKNTKFK